MAARAKSYHQLTLTICRKESCGISDAMWLAIGKFVAPCAVFLFAISLVMARGGARASAEQASEAAANRVQVENAKPGTTDWMLTKTEPIAGNVRDDRYRRQRAIEGYVSHASLRAGETLIGYVSAQPGRLVSCRRLSTRLLRRQRRPPDDVDRPISRIAAGRARRGREAINGGALDPVVSAADSRRLAERRVSRKDDDGRRGLSELPHLGGSRRSAAPT